MLLPQETLVPLGLRQHRRRLVDGRSVMPQEKDEGVAMAARELREVVAERVPGLDAVIEIEVEVELPAALLEVSQPFADSIDLLPGRSFALQRRAGPLDGLVQGLGRLGPMPQGRPEAVRIARFVEPLIELRGLDRRLDHQAVEMLHLEPARRARHVPLPLLLRPSAKLVYRKRK